MPPMPPVAARRRHQYGAAGGHGTVRGGDRGLLDTDHPRCLRVLVWPLPDDGSRDDRLRVLKVDSDEEEEVATALQVRGLPTVMLIRDMSVVMRFEGALMAKDIVQVASEGAPLQYFSSDFSSS